MAQPTSPETAGTTMAGTSRRSLAIVLYVGAVFLYWMALYLYVPTLPVYVQTKSDNLALVGIVLSMYGLWQAIDRFPIGIAADWIGRRQPFIVAGLALAGLGAWIMGRATGIGGLFLGRSITGLAAGAWVPLVAAFSSLFPPTEAVRASSIMTLVQTVGRMAGTGVNGSLNDAGGYVLPFTMAAVASALAVVIVLPVRERVRPPARLNFRHVGALITRPDVLLPSLLAAISQYALWAATFGFLPILSHELGVNDVGQSLLVSLNLGIGSLGTIAVATAGKRMGYRRVLYSSFVLLFIGLVLAAIAWAPAALVLSQSFLGLAYGFGYPVMMGMSMQHVDEQDRTTAVGLFQSTYALGMFGGPAISGLIASVIGLRPMFGVTALVCLLVGWIGTRQLQE